MNHEICFKVFTPETKPATTYGRLVLFFTKNKVWYLGMYDYSLKSFVCGITRFAIAEEKVLYWAYTDMREEVIINRGEK